MAVPQHTGPGRSQGLLGYCTTGACSSPLKTYTFNKQLNEWLKGTNKLLRLCSDQCLCFHPHQRLQPVWYAAPTPWSEPCTGKREEQPIEKTQSHAVTSLSPGSRAVDPDEGSGGVSYPPGCCCSSDPSVDPSLNTLFIGCPIDYMLLKNIFRTLQQ